MTIFTRAGQRRERLGKIGNSHRLQRHVDIPRQIGIDRHEIILAGKLHAEAGEINERDRVGSCGRDLPEKFAKRSPAALLDRDCARP